MFAIDRATGLRARSLEAKLVTYSPYKLLRNYLARAPTHRAPLGICRTLLNRKNKVSQKKIERAA